MERKRREERSAKKAAWQRQYRADKKREKEAAESNMDKLDETKDITSEKGGIGESVKNRDEMAKEDASLDLEANEVMEDDYDEIPEEEEEVTPEDDILSEDETFSDFD